MAENQKMKTSFSKDLAAVLAIVLLLGGVFFIQPVKTAGDVKAVEQHYHAAPQANIRFMSERWITAGR